MWNTNETYNNEFQILLKKLEQASKKFRSKVSQDYLSEVALHLIDKRLNSSFYDSLMNIIVASFDTFPSISQIWEKAEEKGMRPKYEPKAISHIDCFYCGGNGWVFVRKGKLRGAIGCDCRAGQDVSKTTGLPTLKNALNIGMEQITYKDLSKNP